MATATSGTQSQDQSLVKPKTLYKILFRLVDEDVPFENWLIRAEDVEQAREKLLGKLKELTWIDHSRTTPGKFPSMVSIFSLKKGVQIDLNIAPSEYKLIL